MFAPFDESALQGVEVEEARVETAERPRPNFKNLFEIDPPVPSLQWLAATHPEGFHPHTWEHGGMTRILYYAPGVNQPFVAVYRTIAKYLDGAIDIPDEIFVKPENTGRQYNFEVAADGTMVKYPDSENFSDEMLRVVRIIQDLSTQRGASIFSERSFYSTGETWITKEEWQAQPTLSSTQTKSVVNQ